MRVNVKLLFCACVSSNAWRSYPTLPWRRRVTLLRNARSNLSSALSFRSRSSSACSVSVRTLSPPAQCLLLLTELAGHRGDGPTGIDRQLHGLLFRFWSEPPTRTSHYGHPLL